MTVRSMGFIKEIMIANSNSNHLCDTGQNVYFSHLHFPIQIIALVSTFLWPREIKHFKVKQLVGYRIKPLWCKKASGFFHKEIYT